MSSESLNPMLSAPHFHLAGGLEHLDYFSHHIGKFIIPFDEVIFFRVVGIHTTNQSLLFNGYTKAESTDFCDWQGARGTLDEDSGGVAVIKPPLGEGYPLVMTNSLPWKITMLLRTVNHLFLWAIYSMAMLVITRG